MHSRPRRPLWVRVGNTTLALILFLSNTLYPGITALPLPPPAAAQEALVTATASADATPAASVATPAPSPLDPLENLDSLLLVSGPSAEIDLPEPSPKTSPSATPVPIPEPSPEDQVSPPLLSPLPSPSLLPTPSPSVTSDTVSPPLPPLLHLFFYPHVISFYSRFRHIPHRFIHSFIDSFALILLSLTSLGLVYGEYRLLTHFIKPTTPPLIATLSIPTRNQYQVGETFPLPLALDNIPTSINVFQADLSFNPALLEVVSLDTHNTFAKFFVQQEYDNDKGYLRVSGGIPNPGYSQPSGLLSTAYFRVKSAGATELIYLDSSLVLANDGSGTNLLADYPRIPLILTPAESASPQPNALTIRPLVQGETDTTVLTFSQYTHALPLPYQNVEGTSTTSAPLTPSPTHPPNDFSHPILRLDHFILDLYQSLFSYLSL